MAAIHKVRFLPDGQETLVPDGTKLLDAAFQAGVPVDSPCGGRGDCKKCKMEVLEGEKMGLCLACQTYVHCNMTVRICWQQKEERILSGHEEDTTEVDSGLKLLKVRVRPIVPGEAESVWERVREAFQKEIGTLAIKTDISVLSKLYETMMDGDYEIYGVLYGNHLLDVSANRPEPMMIAVDIGTTTLVGYLLDGLTGKLMTTVSEMNPQHRYGADVISRAAYVKEHGGKEMTDCIRGAISGMIESACEKAGVPQGSVYLTVLAGNTCMHHLFLGLSPEALVRAPYSPVIREPLELCTGNYLSNAAKGGRLKLLPNIAGFVGADTTACLLACEFKSESQLTLLMDIGTNGEIVLGTMERAVACSTAAGPAFEGAKITCGMRGANGAIDHVWMKDGELSYSVIGEGKPQGICGSGLMDLMAVLVECGFVDSMGILKNQDELYHEEAVNNGWRIQGEGANRRFVLYNSEIDESSVFLTQKDIGEIQLAKAAMAAGIKILCMRMGVKRADIQKVLVAGAFGNYMDPHSACRIGLIPTELEDKIKMIGNAAGQGAVMAAKSNRIWEMCRGLTAKIEFAELAAEKEFSDLFVEELEFPTDI